MKKIKIIIALILWIFYIDVYNTFISPSGMISGPSFLSSNVQMTLRNANNWLLGIITTISVMAIISGGAGYIYYGYSSNKEKEQIFKKILKYGSIILFFSALTYSLTISVIVDPVF